MQAGLQHTIPDVESAPLINSPKGLSDACLRWQETEALAVDTEFERSKTFFPRIGLMQVADSNGVCLVDPLATKDLSPLIDLLRKRGIVKILHGCREDLEVFYHLGGSVLDPLFDTQLAAAFTGYGYSLGYRRLVHTLFEAELPKEETRSDWLKRPLSGAQRRYAALDVAYLLPAYRHLTGKLEETGRVAWCDEENRRLQDPRRFDPDPLDAYRRVRDINRLDRRALGILQRLCEWREKEARKRDVPRSFVVRDQALVTLARDPPSDGSALGAIDGLTRREVMRSGPALFKLISEAQQISESELPPPFLQPYDHRQHAKVIHHLKAAVKRRAAELALPRQLLADNRTLESLVRRATTQEQQRLPEELCGWRRDIIGDELLAIVGRLSGR